MKNSAKPLSLPSWHRYDYVIGVDESGTGAWAGPFTVCAVLCEGSSVEALRVLGARDSKTLTDKTRRELSARIEASTHVIHLVIATVDVAAINALGQASCWKTAIGETARIAASHIPKQRRHGSLVVVDGSRDLGIKTYGGVEVESIARADATMPAVGAASIVAKTFRNDLMVELHKSFPQYGWDRNAGYGTAEHRAAIQRFGTCAEHRDIKPLREKGCPDPAL